MLDAIGVAAWETAAQRRNLPFPGPPTALQTAVRFSFSTAYSFPDCSAYHQQQQCSIEHREEGEGRREGGGR